MNKKQFDLIAERRFPRIAPAMVSACKSVVFDGSTSYAAEKKNGLGRGTVSRYVTAFHAEKAFIDEVSHYA